MNYKVSRFLIIFVEIVVIAWIVAYVLYPFSDKFFNKFEKEKNVKMTSLSSIDKEKIYSVLGVPEDEVFETVEIKEMYSIPKGFGQSGYTYEIKFSISKKEYILLEKDYEEKTIEEVDESNDLYMLDTENNNKDDDNYNCTIRVSGEDNNTSDEVKQIIDDKYGSKKILIFIVFAFILLFINIGAKYKNGFKKQ